MTLYPIATARQEKILLAAVWETDREGEGGVGGGGGGGGGGGRRLLLPVVAVTAV